MLVSFLIIIAYISVAVIREHYVVNTLHTSGLERRRNMKMWHVVGVLLDGVFALSVALAPLFIEFKGVKVAIINALLLIGAFMGLRLWYYSALFNVVHYGFKEFTHSGSNWTDKLPFWWRFMIMVLLLALFKEYYV
jgi:hypothetical protein